MISPEAFKFVFLFRLFIPVFSWFFKSASLVLPELWELYFCTWWNSVPKCCFGCSLCLWSRWFRAHFSSFKKNKNNKKKTQFIKKLWRIFSLMLIFNIVIWNVCNWDLKGHSIFYNLKVFSHETSDWTFKTALCSGTEQK